jgi:hypothetical protein
MKILLLAFCIVALTAPAQARNVIDWQCGDSRVRLEVNKSTRPPSYDVSFETVDGRRAVKTGQFDWNPKTYVATLDGKRCREIPYQED